MNILIADVKVRPDLIDMSGGMPVGQKELLQLRHRRRLIWLIPEGHTDTHTHAHRSIVMVVQIIFSPDKSKIGNVTGEKFQYQQNVTKHSGYKSVPM